MSGEFTSILDTYSNLRSFRDNVDIVILAKRNPSVIQLRKYLPSEIPINFKVNDLNYDSVICSAFYFQELAVGNINFPLFSCNNLIILDSSSFVMSELNKISILNEIEKYRCKNKYILGNKFNQKYFSSDYYHYYHKFDFSRVEKYRKICKNQIFEKRYFSDPLEYNGYNYYRQIKVKFDPPAIYYENIGKLIFEFQYLERPVFYSPKNKKWDDGLTDYLSLFNINDNIEQELRIQKEEIINKLSFKEDDLILEIIDG